MSAFLDAVKSLEIQGHQLLAAACYDFYAKQCRGKDQEECDRILAMNDEILIKELWGTDPVQPEDVVLGGDFVYLKALARTLQKLDLGLFEPFIELTEEDLVELGAYVAAGRH